MHIATALPAPSLLQLIWFASPALPIGGFSYSEGFEAAVHSGYASTESKASAWLSDQLHVSLARGDLACIAKAIAAWRRGDMEHVTELNQWVMQSRETQEFRLQTRQMGHSFMEWLKTVHPHLVENLYAQYTWAHEQAKIKNSAPAKPYPENNLLSYPIAYALAASSTQASVRDCCLAFTFGWAENMVSAAVKSVPLGQSAGQRILARLAAEIPIAVDYAIKLQDSERQAFSPMLAILSAQHETQYSRLFRS
jgi:urease accessory protein